MMSMYTKLRTKAAGHRTLLPLQHGALFVKWVAATT